MIGEPPAITRVQFVLEYRAPPSWRLPEANFKNLDGKGTALIFRAFSSAKMARPCQIATSGRRRRRMDMTTLLIIIVIVLLLGGGGYYGRGRWW
jgi:hypothetical protein